MHLNVAQEANVTKLLIMILSLLSAAHVKAHAESCATDAAKRNKKTEVIFFNGVGYSEEGLSRNVSNLRAALPQANYVVSGSRSVQQGMASDLLIALEQGLTQRGVEFDVTENIEAVIQFLNFGSLSVGVVEPALEARAEILANYLANLNASLDPINSVTTDRHTRKVRDALRAGRRVVVVAHSQGTLYANAVAARLTTDELRSVSWVYVGAAASSMPDGSGRYITSSNDLIINLIAQSRLPANATPPEAPELALLQDRWGHLFVDTYLYYYRDRIRDMVLEAALAAAYPPQADGSGSTSDSTSESGIDFVATGFGSFNEINPNAGIGFEGFPYFSKYSHPDVPPPVMAHNYIADYSERWLLKRPNDDNNYVIDLSPGVMPAPADQIQAELVIQPYYYTWGDDQTRRPGVAKSSVVLSLRSLGGNGSVTLGMTAAELNENEFYSFDVTDAFRAWATDHYWQPWQFTITPSVFPSKGYMNPSVYIHFTVCRDKNATW